MALEAIDYDNIDKLLNTTELIFNIYNEISKLELNYKDNLINNKIEHLKQLASIETNYISYFSNDIHKSYEVLQYLEDNDERNIFVTKRLISKLSNIIFNYKYKKLISKQNLTLNESVEKGKYEAIEISDSLDKDINTIFIKYLNHHIKNTKNEFWRMIWIDYKYKLLFLSVDKDNFINNYLSDDIVYLSHVLTCDLLNIPNEIRIMKIGNEISNHLNKNIESLLSKKDNALLNIDVMAQSLINSFYIQSCMCLLDDNTKKSLLENINLKISEKTAKKILVKAIEDTINGDYKPSIKYVNINLKIK